MKGYRAAFGGGDTPINRGKGNGSLVRASGIVNTLSTMPMAFMTRTETTDATNWETRTKLADGIADTATLLITIRVAEQHA